MISLRWFGPLVRTIALTLACAGGAGAETLTLSEIRMPAIGPAEVRLTAERPLPYRAFVLDAPPRLVVDAAAPIAAPERLAQGYVTGYRAGPLGEGWSRIVFDLARPMTLRDAGFHRDGLLSVTLARASAEQMAEAARLAPGREVLAALRPPEPQPARGKPRIVLDPGHGGVDPGAVRDGLEEKDIVLAFALELARQIEATGRYEVLLTRSDDRFVLLDDRVAFARAAGAALFLSLHTNSVDEGHASGAVVYLGSDRPSDARSAAVARIENESDARGAADGRRAANDLKAVLVDLARPVVKHRSGRVAQEMEAALRASTGVIRTRPLRSADFRVLRAPDVPSVLLELGFMSDAGDREKMISQEWRNEVASAIVEGLDRWMAADAEFLTLMRE